MTVDFDVTMLRQISDVAEWYGQDPAEFVRYAVRVRLDDIQDNINPQLECWS